MTKGPAFVKSIISEIIIELNASKISNKDKYKINMKTSRVSHLILACYYIYYQYHDRLLNAN